MVRRKKCIVLDIDGTLCPVKKKNERYEDLKPYPKVVKKLREYRRRGFYVILYSSRNMRTFEGNLGLINARTARVLLKWLDEHDIPHDEIHYGKPWAGDGGFYVDDRAVRPDEFVDLSYAELLKITGAAND